MSTITAEQQAAITAKLAGMTLPTGIGTAENACSIAAINLALTGTLTDDIPFCMSEVIGRWIISAQDAMPSEMRNSSDWKELLPLAAGTGRDREKERLEIIMQWMWTDVLPTVQPIADRSGFGAEWHQMTNVKTAEAALAAARAAWAEAARDAARAGGWGDTAALAAARAAAWAAKAGAEAADAAGAAAKAAAGAADAAALADWAAAKASGWAAVKADWAAAEASAEAAVKADWAAAKASGWAAVKADWAAARAGRAAVRAAWAQFNPCGLLWRLIEA